MLTCSKCKQDKRDDLFPINKTSKTGRHNWCKNCQNAYNKEHYKKNKQYYKDKSNSQSMKLRKIVRDYKITHDCITCGEPDPLVLDFDHLGDKLGNVSTLVSNGVSVKRLMDEINKCQILCANCHRRKTALSYM